MHELQISIICEYFAIFAIEELIKTHIFRNENRIVLFVCFDEVKFAIHSWFMTDCSYIEDSLGYYSLVEKKAPAKKMSQRPHNSSARSTYPTMYVWIMVSIHAVHPWSAHCTDWSACAPFIYTPQRCAITTLGIKFPSPFVTIANLAYCRDIMTHLNMFGSHFSNVSTGINALHSWTESKNIAFIQNIVISENHFLLYDVVR